MKDDKEKQEREELLKKIKESIKNNPENIDKQKSSIPVVVEENVDDIKRNEIVEQIKKSIDHEKINNSKSLGDLFEDIENKKNTNHRRKLPIFTRNINLGNVYDN